MTSGPAFVLEEAFPESFADALEEVLVADRELRTASARRSIALMRAYREQVRPEHFESRMLANRSFRAQIALLLSVTEKTAENLIGYSKVLEDAFPKTLAALFDGQISWQHATVIVDELASMEKVGREIIEEQALAEATRVTPHKLGRIVRLARESVNPETIPERHEAARQLRDVELLEDRDGMGGLFIRLPSVHAHAIFNKLTAGARAINGPLEQRTLAQRRADIFAHVMLAEVDGQVFGVVPDEHDDDKFVAWYRGIKAEVVLSVPVLTLLGQSDEPVTLDGWVPVDPDTARIIVAGATSFIRVLTHPETGSILSVGRKRYKVPKDLKRVLQIRDLTCRFPGCELAAWRTDLDHIVEWQQGGDTKLTNLQAICRGHHSLKSRNLWTVTHATDGSGTITWTDQTGRSYTTKPHRPMAA